MKKFRYYALFCAIALSVAVVMGAGAFLLEKGLSEGADPLEAVMRYPELAEKALRATEPAAPPVTELPTEPESTETAETELPTEPVTEATEATEETVPEFNGPMAVFGEDESYFDDALFIGDSRTDGLRLYCPIGQASYFCTTGMTIFDVYEETAPNKDLVEQTLEEMLAEKQFGKIYITLGLNELARKDIVLKAEFQLVINKLRKTQPEAKIYLHAIMPLGKEKSASETYFSMERIASFNQMLLGVAEDMDCEYLDAAEVFAGEDGYLREELSFDGCHLYARNYWMWAEFLCQNAVQTD